MGEHMYDALNMQITKFNVPDKTILDKYIDQNTGR